MGHSCSRGEVFESTNEKVPDDSNWASDPKDIHALIVYVDYGFQPAKGMGWCPAGFGEKLDTYENAMMMKKILEDSGVTSIEMICNTDATAEEVLKLVKKVGKKCDSNDMFFFFYSGHGDRCPDQDGDEEDGMDEAMCTPSKDGNCNPGTYLRDDTFAEAVAEVHSGEKLIILDCCHSGSMLDFNKKFQWEGQHAVSLCGCRDAQESAGMGGGTRGGAFTKCINTAVRELGDEPYSVGLLFNQALSHKADFVPAAHQQDMTISCPAGMDPSHMSWPFVIA